MLRDLVKGEEWFVSISVVVRAQAHHSVCEFSSVLVGGSVTRASCVGWDPYQLDGSGIFVITADVDHA